MSVPDLFAEGLARGWKTYDGSQLAEDLRLEADIAIIGSGAGGEWAGESAGRTRTPVRITGCAQ